MPALVGTYRDYCHTQGHGKKGHQQNRGQHTCATRANMTTWQSGETFHQRGQYISNSATLWAYTLWNSDHFFCQITHYIINHYIIILLPLIKVTMVFNFMLLLSEGRAGDISKICLSIYSVFHFILLFHHTSRNTVSSACTVSCSISNVAKNALSLVTASLFHAIFSFSHHDTRWPPADGSPFLVTAGIPISTVNMIISLPNTKMTRNVN